MAVRFVDIQIFHFVAVRADGKQLFVLTVMFQFKLGFCFKSVCMFNI